MARSMFLLKMLQILNFYLIRFEIGSFLTKKVQLAPTIQFRLIKVFCKSTKTFKPLLQETPFFPSKVLSHIKLEILEHFSHL